MDSKLYNTSLLRTVIQKAVRRQLPDTTIRAVAQTLSQLTRQTATNKNLESLLNRQVTIASEDCSQANLGLLSTCFHSLGAKLKPINRLWKPEKHGFEVAVAAVLSATSTTRDAAILTLQLSSHTPAVKFYKDTNHVANIATRLFSNDPPLDPEKIALALLLVNHACNLGGGTAWNYWREASALADHTLERIINGDDAWWATLKSNREHAIQYVSQFCADNASLALQEKDMLFFAPDHHSKIVYAALIQELQILGCTIPNQTSLKKVLQLQSYYNVRDVSARNEIHSVNFTKPSKFTADMADASHGSHKEWQKKVLQNWPTAGLIVWKTLIPKENPVGKSNKKRARDTSGSSTKSSKKVQTGLKSFFKN